MVVSMTPDQAMVVSGMISMVSEGRMVYLHGEFESVFLDITDSSGKTVFARRIYESGKVVIPLTYPED